MNFFKSLMDLGKKVVEASEALQDTFAGDNQQPTDAHSDQTPTRHSASEGAAAQTHSGPAVDSLYQRHVANGCPDPLQLLPAEDAGRLIGRPVSAPGWTGEEEYISAHFACADDSSTYVCLSVSALMPWDFVTTEAALTIAPRQVGDEARVDGENLYVRQGEHFFWLYGGNVSTDVIYSIAKFVAAALAAKSA